MASTDPPPKKQEKSYLSSAAEAVGSLAPWSTSRNPTPKPPKEVPPAFPPQPLAGPAATAPPPQPTTPDHAVTHHKNISLRRYPVDCPPLKTRWFYAIDTPKRKPKLLRDPKAEPPKPLPPAKKFAPFAVKDSRSIESSYQKFIEEEEDMGISPNRPIDLTGGATPGRPENSSIDGPGTDQNKRTIKVPVNEDFLFDVDIEARELAPVYWLGPIYECRRGTWFYQEGSTLRPCEENLATQLEEGYLKVKPFRYPKTEKKQLTKAADAAKALEAAYNKEMEGSDTDMKDDYDITPKASVENLAAANKRMEEEAKAATEKNKKAVAAHEPGTHRLFGAYMNSTVTYQDDNVAWLAQDGVISRVSSTVYQRFAGGGFMSGTKLVRGYTEGKESKTPTPRPGTPAQDAKDVKDSGLQMDERQQKLLNRRSAPAGMSMPFDKKKGEDTPRPDTPESKEELVGDKLSMLITEASDPAKQEEAIRKRDEKEIQNDYKDDGEDQGREIEHLLLVTHGIGQRLGMRTESVNFIHDVNVLRQNLKSVYGNSADLQALNSEVDKLPKNCRIQVLPVCWRHLLDFPRHGLKQNRKEHDITDTDEADNDYPSLEDITIEGVPFVRSLITDLALDVLLYQSAYREHISGIVLRECNRIYKLFLDRNPYFDGKVSLLGHSLGSAIFFDILCRQKEDKDLANSEKFYHNRPDLRSREARMGKDLSFDFPVEDFYALGSPIGLFQMLKGRTIAARQHPDAAPAESPMDPDYADDPFLSANYPLREDMFPTKTGLPYTISSPKCAQMYNIFHPSDPIAYRLEPLIAPAMSQLKAQALPYTKKGIFGASAAQGISGIGARVSQSVGGLWSSLSSGIASSLLNRSLGLTADDIARMEKENQRAVENHAPLSAAAGTNITAGGVIPPADFETLVKQQTDDKKRQLALDTQDADREGNDNAPTLIDDDIETLYAGFQKGRKSQQDLTEPKTWTEDEEKARKLRREEAKVRGLNATGRVDFSIQE